MVDSGGLENRWSESFRGFESLTFRQHGKRVAILICNPFYFPRGDGRDVRPGSGRLIKFPKRLRPGPLLCSDPGRCFAGGEAFIFSAGNSAGRKIRRGWCCKTDRILKEIPMKETFVRFHSPISLSEYCLINTPAYGCAVPELCEFYQQPNLPIWGLFVSEYIFLQKNHQFNLFHSPIWGK